MPTIMVTMALSFATAMGLSLIVRSLMAAQKQVDLAATLAATRQMLQGGIDCHATLDRFCPAGRCDGDAQVSCPANPNIVIYRKGIINSVLIDQSPKATRIGAFALKALCLPSGLKLQSALLKPGKSILSTTDGDFFNDPLDRTTRNFSHPKSVLFAEGAAPCQSFFSTGTKSPIIPQGVIVMWSGPIANIPQGWALCNGANGTPNLSGRFVVNLGSNGTTNYPAIGTAGGTDQVTLTINQMPRHSHTTQGSFNFSCCAGEKSFLYTFAPVTDGGINPDPIGAWGGPEHQGGNQPFENRPPYYVLAYIMKITSE